ncbi:unnamed protein product [Acanthosepion pharaonis]|uniref:Uncharacterized protein n=1 Tax=Acanthosepion pharaonis TaxID=158019 RepID=A0A812AXD7_ACAPH|nr:unnamed protein product [Sepia pharaonis]
MTFSITFSLLPYKFLSLFLLPSIFLSFYNILNNFLSFFLLSSKFVSFSFFLSLSFLLSRNIHFHSLFFLFDFIISLSFFHPCLNLLFLPFNPVRPAVPHGVSFMQEFTNGLQLWIFRDSPSLHILFPLCFLLFHSYVFLYLSLLSRFAFFNFFFSLSFYSVFLNLSFFRSYLLPFFFTFFFLFFLFVIFCFSFYFLFFYIYFFSFFFFPSPLIPKSVLSLSDKINSSRFLSFRQLSVYASK